MIYDYQCTDCNKVFEVRATLAQKEGGLKPQCPHCGSTAVKQVIRNVNFVSGTKPSKGGNFSSPCCGSKDGAGCC